MNRSELKVGNVYAVQLDDDQADVRLDRLPELGRRHYRCTRLDNGRTIVVKTVKDFLYHVLPDAVDVSPGDVPPHWVEPTLPARPVSKELGERFLKTGEPGFLTSPQKATAPVSGPTRPLPASFVSRMQEQEARVPGCTGPHVIIRARAGTGKTTTIVEGLKELKQFWPCRACNGPSTGSLHVCAVCRGTGRGTRLTPSPQQQAIWDTLCQSRDAATICMVAFNKSIAEELKRRVPPGVQTQTIHSMGYQTIKSAHPSCYFKEDRLRKIVAGLVGMKFGTFAFKEPVVCSAVMRLVPLCKLNLIPMSEDDAEDATEVMYRDGILHDLAAYHGVELEDTHTGQDHSARVFDLVPKIVTRCRDVERDACFDHDDMVWLPIVLGLPIYRYDLLFVDESQDLNRCQQAVVKAAGHRLIFCGDDRQACYGFAGSDVGSVETLERDMRKQPRGCVVLPLTVTRRCGKAIVEEARKIVPDFEAHEANHPGTVRELPYGQNGNPGPGTYHEHVRPGDMVICRVTGPLVGQCLKFIAAGRYATVQGRDMVSGLRALAEKCSQGNGHLEHEPGQFITALNAWARHETERENKRADPSVSKLLQIQDKAMCLTAFYTNFTGAGYQYATDGPIQVRDFLNAIDSVFQDGPNGTAIKLSTIHRAKGLESGRVFFLMPERAECPHPLAKQEWQIQQEWNLRYIGITRAVEELVYVR